MLHEAEILSRKQESIPGENESLESGEPVAEYPEDPERLVAKLIGSAEQEVEALSREGEARMGQANDSINLSPEKVGEIIASSDIRSNLGTISEKAKQLLTEMRSKMKSAAAIGMAALALGGAGDFERDRMSVLSESGVSATETMKDQQTDSVAKIEAREQNEAVQLEKSKEKIKKIKEGAEKIREDLIKHINSEDYFNRLIIEAERSFNPDKNSPRHSPDEIAEFARRLHSMRIERLEKVKFIVLPLEDLQAEHNKKESGDKGSRTDGAESQNVLAFAKGTGEIYLPLDETNEDIILHELVHLTTIDENELLSDSYIKRNDELDVYLGSGAERRAFKKALDFEFEKLGIKKYGETFTKEHFKKMMECYEQGKFSPGANVFIRTTNPELFEKIFNEIAANEVNKQEQSA